MGFVVLEGGGEFGGQMAAPDRWAMDQAGGPAAPVVIMPTAAAPDNNHERAGANGTKWFARLGARNVRTVPLIDKASAEDPGTAAVLAGARLIFLLGGFPGYLEQTLRGTAGWQGVLEAYEGGAVLAGSSAGAMVLGSDYFDPGVERLKPGLGLLEDLCILPHHNTFGRRWTGDLSRERPELVLLGIDEQTGICWEQGDTQACVLGRGMVTLYRDGAVDTCSAGERLDLSRLVRR
jgi:cyanophycinase